MRQYTNESEYYAIQNIVSIPAYTLKYNKWLEFCDRSAKPLQIGKKHG